jgi:hypothetical protein
MCITILARGGSFATALVLSPGKSGLGKHYKRYLKIAGVPQSTMSEPASDKFGIIGI